MNRGLVAWGVALTGCLEHVQLDRDDLPGLVAIEVSPGDDTIALALPGPPQTVAYRATGQFADGGLRDITDRVEWTVDNPFPGSLAAGGRYTTSNTAAGHVAIRAGHRGVTGAAALTVAITAAVVDDSFPPPGGAQDLFAPGTPAVSDAMRSSSARAIAWRWPTWRSSGARCRRGHRRAVGRCGWRSSRCARMGRCGR